MVVDVRILMAYRSLSTEQSEERHQNRHINGSWNHTVMGSGVSTCWADYDNILIGTIISIYSENIDTGVKISNVRSAAITLWYFG